MEIAQNLALEDVDVLLEHEPNSHKISIIKKGNDILDAGVDIQVDESDLKPLVDSVKTKSERDYGDIVLSKYDAKLFYNPQDSRFHDGDRHYILIRIFKGIFAKEIDFLFHISSNDLDRIMQYVYRIKQSRAA